MASPAWTWEQRADKLLALSNKIKEMDKLLDTLEESARILKLQTGMQEAIRIEQRIDSLMQTMLNTMKLVETLISQTNTPTPLNIYGERQRNEVEKMVDLIREELYDIRNSKALNL